MTNRQITFADRLCLAADNFIKTLSGGLEGSERINPASGVEDVELTEDEKCRSANLMRVNHTGEVCAQALYQGQALTARLPDVRAEMEKACEEEVDHLNWCAQRIHELGSHTSYLNPVFYSLSFAIGAGAGAISDRLSLGFVAATEDLVVQHLESHLGRLSEADLRSRAIVDQMRSDEASHQQAALDAGGMEFTPLTKQAMQLVSRIMTATVAKI